MAKRARWMREGRQTFHEGITHFILSDLCKQIRLTMKNQKIFYHIVKKKWYIVDFYIPELKLVIEIDGKSHETQKKYDETRTAFLKSVGCQVCRIKNEDTENLEYRGKLEQILTERMVEYYECGRSQRVPG